ncbi:MAG TPA: TetR/AcrR family transcriptional regulator [Solirubrobacterales bacterium]|nr:TetR/AcrR family transcriptional regulator [Solirubrobacterales bacterium]
MGRRKQDEEPGLSRETILAEAARLFKRNGYRKTRLEELAQVLGVTRPAIYYHFKAKQDLLVAMYMDSMASLDRIAAGDEADEGLPPVEQFWRRIEAHAFYIASYPVQAGIFFEEEEELPEGVHTEVRRMLVAYTDRLVELYSAAQASGDAPEGDPRVAVSAILGGAIWTYRWYPGSDWDDPRAAAREVVRVLRSAS